MDGVEAPAPAAAQDGDVGWCEARRNARLGDAPPPLPFNWRLAANGMYEKLGYMHDALGKDWRWCRQRPLRKTRKTGALGTNENPCALVFAGSAT